MLHKSHVPGGCDIGECKVVVSISGPTNRRTKFQSDAKIPQRLLSCHKLITSLLEEGASAMICRGA